jgi:hypothetical protein
MYILAGVALPESTWKTFLAAHLEYTQYPRMTITTHHNKTHNEFINSLLKIASKQGEQLLVSQLATKPASVIPRGVAVTDGFDRPSWNQ